MWNKLVLVLLIGIASVQYGYAQKDSQIQWSEDYQLQWSDFKSLPDKSTNLKAMTSSGINFGIQCIEGQLDLEIGCYFDKYQSWVKEGPSDELLEHERLHFDITELYTRKLIKKLVALKDPCGRDLEKMQQIYNENFEEYDAYQNRYDKETKHSIDTEKQKYWEELVAQELERYKPWSSELWR